jgi:hypothetical protein
VVCSARPPIEWEIRRMDEKAKRALDARDAITALILGTFLCVMSLPVFAGVFFEEKQVDIAISIVAGSVILLAGAGFVFRAVRIHRKSGTRWTE